MSTKCYAIFKLLVILLIIIFVQSCSTGKSLQREPMENKFARGMEAFEQKNYFDAKDIFEDLVSDKGDDPRYREMLGYTLIRFGRLNEGRSIIDSVLEEFPDRRYAMLDMSEIYLKEGEIEKQIAILEKIATLYPDDITAYKAITMHFWKQNNLKESSKWVQLALKNNPSDQWAQNMLSQINMAKKKSLMDINNINNDNILTTSELKFLHNKYKIEGKVPWSSIKVVQDWEADKKINRRDFLLYFTDVFSVYLGVNDFHKSFADTETTIKDLQKKDPDYSKVLYFIARDMSFEYVNENIILDKIVSESEAIDFLVQIQEQISI